PSYILAFCSNTSASGMEAASRSARTEGLASTNSVLTTGTMSLAGKPSVQGSLTQPSTPSRGAASSSPLVLSGRLTSGTSIQTTSSPGFSTFTVQFGVHV